MPFRSGPNQVHAHTKWNGVCSSELFPRSLNPIVSGTYGVLRLYVRPTLPSSFLRYRRGESVCRRHHKQWFYFFFLGCEVTTLQPRFRSRV